MEEAGELVPSPGIPDFGTFVHDRRVEWGMKEEGAVDPSLVT